VDHEESTEVTAMRIEQRHIRPSDPAIGLHAPEHLDELAEHLDRPFLAAAYRCAEPNEQGSIGHHDSFLSLDDPNLSEPAGPRKPIGGPARPRVEIRSPRRKAIVLPRQRSIR
jgi:hypothetical protein